MKKLSLVSLFALCLSLPFAAAAAVPGTLAFSARIADSGKPVTGSHTVKFAFWDCDGSDPSTCVDPTNVLWSETQTLTVSDGVLSAVLGADTTTPNPLPPPIFNGAPMFLEVTFDGTAFTPRMPVHSVPYAFRAAAADTAVAADYATDAAHAATVNMAGSGTATTAAHSDHTHPLRSAAGSSGDTVVKRYVNWNTVAGTLVARTDSVILERDGTSAGFRVTKTGGSLDSISCTFTNTAGGVGGASLNPAVGTTALIGNAANAMMIQCVFGNIFGAGHVTHVTMSRYSTDYYWAVFVTSSYDQ